MSPAPPHRRSVVRRSVPRAITRAQALFALAADDLGGPDPESALWHMRSAKRALDALLKALPPH